MIDDDGCRRMGAKGGRRIHQLVWIALQIKGQAPFAHQLEAFSKYRIAQEVPVLYLGPRQIRVVGVMIENHAHTAQTTTGCRGMVVQHLPCLFRTSGQMHVRHDTHRVPRRLHLLADESRFAHRVDDGPTWGLPDHSLHVYTRRQLQRFGQARHVAEVVGRQIYGLLLFHGATQIRIRSLVDIPEMKVWIT